MSDETVTEIAESVIEQPAEQSNMTAADFIARRLGQRSEPTESETAPPLEEVEQEETEGEEDVPQAQEEVEEEATEAEAKEAETEASSEDVLSQFDLDDMSEEDLRELSEKLGSRAVARFGELTARRKAAEERLALLEAKLQETPKTLKAPEKVANNPFASLDSVEAVQEQAEEVNSVIEWAEDVLFNADGYAPDDVVTTVGGKEMTKADVRKTLLNSRKSRDKFLPAQLQEIQAKEQGTKLSQTFAAKAVEELSWLSGEDNDTRQQYNAIMRDKRVEKMLADLPPDVSAQMPYLMAHAANSLYGRKLVPQETAKVSPKLNPPKTVDSSAAMTEKQSSSRDQKAIQNLAQQWKDSGNKSDFIKLRTKQLLNR